MTNVLGSVGSTVSSPSGGLEQNASHSPKCILEPKELVWWL